MHNFCSIEESRVYRCSDTVECLCLVIQCFEKLVLKMSKSNRVIPSLDDKVKNIDTLKKGKSPC